MDTEGAGGSMLEVKVVSRSVEGQDSRKVLWTSAGVCRQAGPGIGPVLRGLAGWLGRTGLEVCGAKTTLVAYFYTRKTLSCETGLYNLMSYANILFLIPFSV